MESLKMATVELMRLSAGRTLLREIASGRSLPDEATESPAALTDEHLHG
jgi:hypothetical protein